MKTQYQNIKPIMSPKSVAIIGASDKPEKVGHVIMKNYIDVGFQGPLYPVNIGAEPNGKIMGHTAYRSVLDIKEPIDLAVIAIPAKLVPKALEECGKAKVSGVVIVSGGFAEIGEKVLEEKIAEISRKYKLPFIGPNCLGVMDPRSRNDTLFLPTSKIDRPKIGGVSFVSQSGSVGSSTLDLISGEGFGLAHFISYGNATVVDEVDILNYLADDPETKVIVYYLEGARRGKEFMEVAKRTAKKKPVVMIKGGISPAGAGAAHSHTASLAGSAEAYDAIFRQSGFVIARELNDLLYYAKIFETQPLTTGNRIAVMTNGGGHGVLATDALYLTGLRFPQLTDATLKALRKSLPPIVNVEMPLDVGGEADAQRYINALEILAKDPNVDAFMIIALFQTPGADEKLANTISQFASNSTKPVVVVSSGATYTRTHTILLEEAGVPVYDSPTSAARSLAALIKYSKFRAGMIV